MTKTRIAIIGAGRGLGARLALELASAGFFAVDGSKLVGAASALKSEPSTAWADTSGGSRRAQWKDETNYRGRRR